MDWIQRKDVFYRLPKHAQRKVLAVIQEEDTKIYYIILKEGYCFEARRINGEMRGYGTMPCKTQKDVMRWCRMSWIQDGRCLKKYEDEAIQTYLSML